MTRLPVSVVIPCYRCSGTVARAVASVAAQTQLPAELILVDDGSADDTAMALAALRAEYGDWVRVLQLPHNGGPAAARNAGWDAASQPLVAFLDADDSWHPQKLELQCGWMLSHPHVLLTGHRYVQSQPWPERVQVVGAQRIQGWRQLLSNRFVTSSVMLRREVPHRFESAKRRSEDNLLWLTIILGGGVAYRLDAPLVRFHKPLFGASGLSAELWKMQAGQLDTFRRVYRAGLIGPVTYLGVSAFALIKFLRRLALTLPAKVRSP